MRLSIRSTLAIAAAAAAAAIAPAAASAATINVDIRTDEFVNNGVCSLREAVQSANVDNVGQVEGGCETGSGLDNIVLPSGAPYTLTIALVADGIATGDLEVTDVDGTNFVGGGIATTIIDAGGALGANDRVLDITAGVGTVGLSDVTIQNGLVTAGNGGGILSNAGINLSGARVTGNTATTGNGGGIQLSAARTITMLPGSSVDTNTATVGTGGGIDLGNGGSLDANLGGSEISENTAGSAGGGVNLSLGTGTIDLEGTIVDDNNAVGLGGGISSTNGRALTLDEASITGNGLSENVSSIASGGGIHFVGGVGGLQLTDTLVSTNTIVGEEAQGGGLNINALAGGVSLTRTAVMSNQVTVEDDGVGGATFEGGGGIMLSGVSPATITDSLVAANIAVVNDPDDTAGGAGIFDNGTLTVDRTTIQGNDLSTGNPGGRGGAGLRAAVPAGPTRILNSTISGNTMAGTGVGGGVAANTSSHPVTIAQSTFALNDAGFGDAINLSGGGTFTLRGNLIDEGAGLDSACFPDGLVGAVNGFNVDAGTSCVGAANDTDLENTDPTLGPLVDNGGPLIGGPAMESTQTHELSGPAAAIDAVPQANCEDLAAADLLVDQRGAPRPTDAGCEPGSYELIRCQGQPAYVGSPGVDTLDAAVTGADVIHGLGGADTINGDGDINRLCGGDDGDVLNGAGGDDQLDGGGANDRASFAGGAGVDANLVTDLATGQGTDQLLSIENLEGSSNADTLTGDDGINGIFGVGGGDTLTGGGGADLVQAGVGGDQILIRDGITDSADCGPDVDADTVTTDAQGVDTLTSCDGFDTVNFLTPPPVVPPSTPTTTPTAPATTPKKCKKGQKLKKGKCVKKKRKKRK